MEQQTRTRSMSNSRGSAVYSSTVASFDGTSSEPYKPTTSVDYPGTIGLGAESKTMTDVVTENFLKLVNSGAIINNPMSSTYVDEKTAAPEGLNLFRSNANANGGYSGFRQTGSAPMPDSRLGDYLSVGLSDSQRNTAHEIAVTAALAGASASDVLVVATLGESRETFRMFLDLFKQVIKLKNAVRRLDLKYAKGLISPKVYKEKYLLYRYGLRPLIFDARNIVAALSSEPRSPRMTFRGSNTVRENRQDVITTSISSINCTVTRTCYAEYQARAGVLANIDYTPVAVWGLDQWVESAWELVPFSFVLDWFFNIGKLLASWTPNAGVYSLASWVVLTETTAQSNTCTSVTTTHPSYTTQSISWGGAKSRISIVRSRVPRIQPVITPHLDVKLDPAKILDLLAIFRK